ncbi:UPF0280 family protein [Pseudooceanicola sp. 216_PA32_1]|uniref:UPF0280 family protein n=1 Tax=Pseudooceanicola pacificus TaxID=2676438 RepID=A0A844W545_9RHOB|nr:UPF0280 family protein [Pseudooceanicola pacificus]MWB78967.1 UPF0280 family protein [Pseudooceanicola pacificus]
MTGPQIRMLPDGERMHLHEGPIDLIVKAEGAARAQAMAAAAARFEGLLQELVSELPALRRADSPPLLGHVARRMRSATVHFKPEFITPMAAVAGAVADEILASMSHFREVTLAWVNNGGDVAFHLTPRQEIRAAMPGGTIRIDAQTPWRGMATSGWGGRSHSLGMADAVTAVARSAALADAAATMIANRIDLPGHPAVTRVPASQLSPDSDLGDRPVTTGVGALSEAEIEEALARGATYAEGLVSRGLIGGARLELQGRFRLVGGIGKLVTDAGHD